MESQVVDKRATLHAICERFDVQILYVFGSRAREALSWLDGDEATMPATDSDLDVGVKTAVPLSVQQKVQLALALEDLFGVGRVDLAVLPEVDPFLAANIIRGERLYAQDEYLADEYDLYILRRAGDLIPLERERQQLVLESKK